MESARYSDDPVGNISKLLQIKDGLARQRMFQNAYNAQIANGGQGGGQAGSGDPAMQDFRGIMPANQAEQMFDLAATTYGPDVANSMRENWKASQPTYTTINGRQYVNNGLNARSQVPLQENKDGFTFVADPNAPGGERAVATPGYLGVKTNTTIAGAIKPPVDGAVPAYDADQKLIGWMMPNGGFQTMQQAAAAKAQGEGSAKPYLFTNPDGSQTLTSEAGAANAGRGGGVRVGPQYGSKDLYEGAVKAYQGYQSDRADAETLITNVNQLGAMLEGLRTGRLSPMGNELAAAAQAAGLPGAYKGLSNQAAIAAINKNLVGTLRQQAGMTRMTDADLRFLNNGLPGIQNTPQGNALALDYMRSMAQRRVDRTNYADKWVQHYGSLAAPGAAGPNFEAAYAAWQAKNPVFGGRR